jgi:hypothetical protein
MDACEPRSRRRGFFLHSSDSEPDSGEHENPEGFIVRVRFPGHPIPRKMASSRRAVVSGSRFSGGRSHRSDPHSGDGEPAIRSGSVTGSRQRAHLPR